MRTVQKFAVPPHANRIFPRAAEGRTKDNSVAGRRDSGMDGVSAACSRRINHIRQLFARLGQSRPARLNALASHPDATDLGPANPASGTGTHTDRLSARSACDRQLWFAVRPSVRQSSGWLVRQGPSTPGWPDEWGSGPKDDAHDWRGPPSAAGQMSTMPEARFLGFLHVYSEEEYRLKRSRSIGFDHCRRSNSG